jgi:hypothetical protein
MRLFLALDPLEGDQLRLGENPPLLRNFRFQRFETLLHRGEVVADPHTAHAGRRDRPPLLGELVGHSVLAPRRLIDRHRDDQLFEIARDPVAQIRLASADLAQRVLATRLIQLFEPIEAVAAVPHDLAGLGHVSQLLGEIKDADFGLDDFLLSRH